MSDVVDNSGEHRFELVEDGQTAFASYRIDDGRITFTHTIVPPALAGHGVGSRLVRAALNEARGRGLRVVAQCSFVAAYIERHPEFGDLST